MTRLLYTMEEAAERLGLSVKALRAAIRADRIEFILVAGGAKRQGRMFSEANLEGFARNQSLLASRQVKLKPRKRKKANTTVAEIATANIGVMPPPQTDFAALSMQWEETAAKKLYKSKRNQRKKQPRKSRRKKLSAPLRG